MDRHATAAETRALMNGQTIEARATASGMHPVLQGYAPPKLRQVIAEAVFRRQRIVLTTVALAVALVGVATLLMHRKYQSSAKLVVQNVRTAAQLSTSNVDRLVSQGDISPTEINTEVDLLQSDEVARRALGGNAAGGLGTDREDRAVRNLEGRLSVEAVHQTNVIDLKVLANSPAQANADLQHVIDAYFEERAGTARNSGAAGFFDTQLKAKSEQLDQDQAALTAFQMQHGIADLDDQTKLQITRISALQDQLAAARTALAAQRSKTVAQKRELEATAPRAQTQQRTITNQYSQERLNTSMVDLENRRTELSKRYAPSDRQIVEVDEKIATIRAAIAEAGKHPAGEAATDVNPVWEQLSLALATAGGEMSGLQGQCTALQQQIGTAQQRLNELEQATTQYGELRRKVQQSQADYTLYAQRRDEARISEALDREKLFNVAVLQRPLAVSHAVRPKPLLYLLVAFVFSLFAGTALALYTDLSGGQVHSPAQLEAITGVRTLATFADEAPKGGAAEGNRLQYRRVLFAIRQMVHALRPELAAAAAVSTLVTAGGASDEEEENQRRPQAPCVAFTSALRGEGVSYLAGHLAMETARQASNRVAVFDMPALMEQFETFGDCSLATRFEEQSEHWVLSMEEPPFRPSTPRRGGAQSQFSLRLRQLLEEARTEFDLLVLDCPSLQASTLGIELAPCVDGYVAVVQADAARRQNIEDMISQLASTSAPVLGYVLNRRDYPVPRWLYRILW